MEKPAMKVREFAGLRGVQAKTRLRAAGKNLETNLKTQFPQLLTRLSIIGVDAEGFDIKILQSLSIALSECRPFIKEIKSLNFNVFGLGTVGPGAVH
jgi:hypothetical protein